MVKKSKKKKKAAALTAVRLREYDATKAENLRLAISNGVPEEWALKWSEVPLRRFKNWLRHHTEFRQTIRRARAASAQPVVKAWNTLSTRGVNDPKIALRFLEFLEEQRAAHPRAITIRDPLVPHRPTMWTLEKQAFIATLVSYLVSLKRAARYAGVNYDAAYHWMKAGHAEFQKDEPDRTSYQFQFFVAITNAVDRRVIGDTIAISTAGETDIEQKKYQLERSEWTRDEFASRPPKVQVGVGVNVSSPQQQESVIAARVAALPDDVVDADLDRYDRVLALVAQEDGTFA